MLLSKRPVSMLLASIPEAIVGKCDIAVDLKRS